MKSHASLLAAVTVVLFAWLPMSMASAGEVRSDRIHAVGMPKAPDESGHYKHGNEDKVDFGRQIRPLLAEKCFQCHGLGEEHRETDMRLDTKQGLFAEVDSGGCPVVPGKPAESLIYQRISSDDEYERMPPVDSHKDLSKEQIALIKRWIEQGAPWKQHWSLIAPQKPPVPQVGDSSWPRNEIDRFILARLDKEGLKPSPPADKTTLIRRLTFDLTGLPPTPAEIDDFLSDDSPTAYEKLVDRLLQSPHYGEHMGRYWLDAARYGDTHGLHLDNFRQIWPYRDWVIQAFNKNMPFDQFTIEQLAGDLLPNPSIEQRIATGFNRCNVTTSEGGAISEEYLVHYSVDRVATTSTVWMGISMGCAVCHDHKFDPFSTRDFYQLYAFFNSLNGPVMDGNQPLPAPVIKVPAPGNREPLKKLLIDLAAQEKRLKARRGESAADFAAWEKSLGNDGGAQSVLPTAGLLGHWPLDETDGDQVRNTQAKDPAGTLRGAQRVDGKSGRACKVGPNEFVDLGDTAGFERTDAFSYGAWVNLDAGNGGGAVIARMDDANQHRGYDLYIAGNRAIAHIIHSWAGNAVKVETKNTFELKKWQHLLVTYDGSGKAGGVKIYINGKPSPLTVRNDSLTGTIKNDVSLQIGRRTPGSPLKGLVDEVRIYNRVLSPLEAAMLADGQEIRDILAREPKDRSPQQKETLLTYYLTNHDSQYQKLNTRLGELQKEKQRLETEGQIASLIWEDTPKPKPAHMLIRGQYDKPGEEVSRNTPAALPPLAPPAEGKIPTRLSLARWLVSPEHPLTSRVTVNRLWQQFFGVGIVKTAEDFGSQGEQPSHPELLDWLAVDFRTNGWDIKRFVKQIVTSSTYRQSSRISPALAKKDPENRLLARGPRFRLDAEMIRDNALSVSGLLVEKIGGPSVKPYQPPGLWKAVGYTDSNTANFKRDSGEALYRRSLYTFWKRTSPPPSLVTFDAPSRETCTVRRSRTNTPLAALALMNDEQFVEASRALAERLMTEGGKTDAERASFAFRLATARRPKAKELQVLLDVYKAGSAKFQANKDAAAKLISVGESKPDAGLDPSRLAAWTMVANLILNLDETITKG